jgi:hypothetical protein
MWVRRAGARPGSARGTAALRRPRPLDLLSINERKPTGARKPLNDFILEGLDLLFAKRGLPSVDELSEDRR